MWRWVGLHLGDPQGTADVRPLGAGPRGLHGPALLGAQQALGVDAQDTRPAQPVPIRHLHYAITGLGWRARRIEMGGGGEMGGREKAES